MSQPRVMILHAPGVAPRRVDDLVEAVDLTPTLLDLLGIGAPAGFDVAGRSLLPLLSGESLAPRSFVFSSAAAISERHADRRYRLREDAHIHAARSCTWKLVLYPGVDGDYVELYDMARDPGEARDLGASEPGALFAASKSVCSISARSGHLKYTRSMCCRQKPRQRRSSFLSFHMANRESPVQPLAGFPGFEDDHCAHGV